MSEQKKKIIATKMSVLRPGYTTGLKKNTGPHFEKLKENQKGRQSLEKPKGEHNTGEGMYLGKNEHNRP